jgi:phosphonate transport system permease protein
LAVEVSANSICNRRYSLYLRIVRASPDRILRGTSTAKLWAKAIENISPGPLEAASATGVSRLKVVAYALVPDVAPSMVSVGLFWWEFNVRASTVLGVVGAGGIGQELKNSMDLLLFPRLLTIILLILVTVTVIDHASEWLRRKLE